MKCFINYEMFYKFYAVLQTPDKAFTNKDAFKKEILKDKSSWDYGFFYVGTHGQ